jgi:hypothetical protein
MVNQKELAKRAKISGQLEERFTFSEAVVNRGELKMSPIGDLMWTESGYLAYIQFRGRVPEDLYGSQLSSHFKDRIVTSTHSLEGYLQALQSRETQETLEWRIRGTGIALVGLHFMRHLASGDRPEFSWWIMQEGLKESYQND